MTLGLEAQVALIREWNAAVIAEARECRTKEDEHWFREWERHKALPKNRAAVARWVAYQSSGKADADRLAMRLRLAKRKEEER